MEEMNYTNNEVDAIDNEEVTMVTDVSEESEGGGILGKVVAGVVMTGVAVGIGIFVKNKDKRKAKKIAKAAEMLKKEGYNIEEPAVEEGDVIDVEADEVTEAED
jgi:hypothetical protein